MEHGPNYEAIRARNRLADVQERMAKLIMEKLYWEEQLAMAIKKSKEKKT